MNIEQADRILKKINLLFETMALDDKIDVFEQDLMLSYIRQLREAFSPAETNKGKYKPGAPLTPVIPAPKAEIKTSPKTGIKEPVPLSTHSKPRPRRSWAFPGTTASGPVAKKPASLPVVKKPEVKEAPKPLPKPPVSKVEVKKAPKPAPEPPVPTPEVKKAPKPAPVEYKPPTAKKVAPPKVKVEKKPAPTPKPKILKPVTSKPVKAEPEKYIGSLRESDYEALFEYKDAKELDEMEHKMPIKDLTKVMGSREKTSTINELFGGDRKAYDVAIKTLDGFRSFNQAKKYLAEKIAAKYGWPEKSKKEKAADFVELLRRRYK